MAKSSKHIHFKPIVRVLGYLTVIEAVMMAVSIPISLSYGENDWKSFVYSIVILFGLSFLCWLISHKDKNEIAKREGYLIVVLAWLNLAVFGTFPFIFSGAIPSFTDAFFECISGFTTTGATILPDVEQLPHGLLFWRATTNWIGGMGIIVLTVAILPFLGISGMQMFASESTGPTKYKLHPKIKETAKRLWGIYIILTISQITCYVFAGMDSFDAVCHAFSTIATGGFSTKVDSFIGYSPLIQYITIFFMVVAGTNFSLHYFFLHGHWKRTFRDTEYRVYLSIIFVSTLIIFIGLSHAGEPTEVAFRDALFQTTSIITTTGFISSDYMIWPTFLWMIIFLLFFVGGMAGSTAGGIKNIRLYLLVQNSYLSLKRLIHPNAVMPVRLGNKIVSEEVVFKVMAFFLIFFLCFAGGIFAMSLLGLDFETSISTVASALGNVGPGLGTVGAMYPYTHIPLAGKWILSFFMLLGRLEFFTILVLFTPAFWKS
ncbi:MAG: potassium transporter TrkG [Bacteroidales bacterium]|nr:potassium transporter TrkG [Bacteroidales bacterium]